MTQEGLFKQSFIQFGAWLILYLFISKMKWFEDTMNDGLIIVLVAIISYLISLVTILYRPIVINIEQKDHNHNHLDNMGIIVERKKITTIQKDRIIDVNVSMNRKKSLWWGLLLKSMRKYKVYIDFRLTRPALTLTPSKFNTVCEANVDFGFILNINGHLETLSEGVNGYSINEKYCYYPSYDEEDNSSYLLPDLEYVVVPKLKIEATNPTIFSFIVIGIIKLLIGFKPKNFTLNIKQR